MFKKLPEPSMKRKEVNIPFSNVCAAPRAIRAVARRLLGCPKLCKLAHAFLRGYSYKGLKLAQILGQLGVFLTQAGK